MCAAARSASSFCPTCLRTRPCSRIWPPAAAAAVRTAASPPSCATRPAWAVGVGEVIAAAEVVADLAIAGVAVADLAIGEAVVVSEEIVTSCEEGDG